MNIVGIHRTYPSLNPAMFNPPAKVEVDEPMLLDRVCEITHGKIFASAVQYPYKWEVLTRSTASLQQLKGSAQKAEKDLAAKLGSLIREISEGQAESANPHQVIEHCELVDKTLSKLRLILNQESIEATIYEQNLRIAMMQLFDQCKELHLVHQQFLYDFPSEPNKIVNNEESPQPTGDPFENMNPYVKLERELTLQRDKELLKHILLEIAQEDKATCKKIRKLVQKTQKQNQKNSIKKFKLVMMETTPNQSPMIVGTMQNSFNEKTKALLKRMSAKIDSNDLAKLQQSEIPPQLTREI